MPIIIRLIGFLPCWMSLWLHSQIRSINHVQLFSHVLWRTCYALWSVMKSLCNVGRRLAMSCNLPRYSLQVEIPRLDFLEAASEESFLWKNKNPPEMDFLSWFSRGSGKLVFTVLLSPGIFLKMYYILFSDYKSNAYLLWKMQKVAKKIKIIHISNTMGTTSKF